MRPTRIVVLVILALGLVLLVWAALRPAPVPVEVAEVRRAPLQVTVDETGQTRTRDLFVVAAPVAGELQRVQLRAGDSVERDDLLVEIAPARAMPLDARTRAELQQRLQAVEASRRSAEASLRFARQELERTRQLVETGALATRALDEARLREEAAARSVEEARATAAAIRAQLGLAEGNGGQLVPVRAPASGRVLRVMQESAAVVGAGTPILAIGDAGDLEVVADVLSEEAVAIPAGAPVILDRWGGTQPLRGQVRRVEPSAYTRVSALGVEEQRVDVVIDLLDPPETRAGLGHGYRVEARIVVWSVDEAVVAPVGALFRRGDAWAVFVVDEGAARARQVVVGRRGETEAQILEGLAPGEQVVVYPGDRLADGVRVEAR